MKDFDPKRVPLLIWGVAFMVFISGVLLSRHEEVRRVDRNRDALRDFAAGAQLQVQRLEALYERHLMRLGWELVADEQMAAQAADQIVGIIRVSMLGHEPGNDSSFHVLINSSSGGPPPLPALKRGDTPAVPVVLLDDEILSRGSGWIDEPDKPLMFHMPRNPHGIVVITVSREEAGRAIRNWLELWAEQNFDELRKQGGPDQLREKGNGALISVGETKEMPPDLAVPLIGRFINLEVASWDARDVVVTYNPLKLAVSVTLAVGVLLFAFITYLVQKRQYLQAMQRASFVNSVSHELRTPLTNIMLNIDLAVELSEDSPQQAAKRLALVRREARRLGRLIENVLTFSRAEKGKLEVRATDCSPTEVIAEVIDQFEPSLARRGLSLEWIDENPGEVCKCDPDALTQILGNLLSNVEKYVSSGKVVVRSRVADREIVVRVTDEGPGIPAGAAERIFKPFERLHSKLNEGESGTGLGLAISRDLAERSGGSLCLLPVENASGSSFELRMPASAISTHKKS